MQLITNTFVLVASDCPALSGTMPVPRGETPTVPVLQYELLTAQPYKLTLEDLMFEVHVRREGLSKAEAKSQASEIQAKLFSKSYPCMRASPLPKKFGWGVHHDASGRIALYGVESAEYQRFARGEVKGVEVVMAMRSKRAE
ncbi:MAG TPA: DUF6157 family protein [Gemmata sp.]|nr:DUF6157 family protein [Gemmata sp.]